MIEGIFRYIYTIFVAFLLVLGAANMYDIYVGDTFPAITGSISIHSSDVCYDYPQAHLSKNFDETEAWDALQPALAILDEICPQASLWARDRHAIGKLEWTPLPDGTYAKFDFITKSLIINAELFSLNNGERAVTIAHEFRHSRQNLSKFVKLTVALMLTGRRQTEIVETDAYLYENEVRRGIFGW